MELSSVLQIIYILILININTYKVSFLLTLESAKSYITYNDTHIVSFLHFLACHDNNTLPFLQLYLFNSNEAPKSLISAPVPCSYTIY